MIIKISAEAVIVSSFKIPGLEREICTIFKPSKHTRKVLEKMKNNGYNEFKITDGPRSDRQTFSRQGCHVQKIVGYDYDVRLDTIILTLE